MFQNEQRTLLLLLLSSSKLKKFVKPTAFETETSVFNLQTSKDPIKVIPPAQMDIMPLVT